MVAKTFRSFECHISVAPLGLWYGAIRCCYTPVAPAGAFKGWCAVRTLQDCARKKPSFQEKLGFGQMILPEMNFQTGS